MEDEYVGKTISDAFNAVYLSGILEDNALVMYVELHCPKIGGEQPVFFSQKTISCAVRAANGIESPYAN